MTAKPEFNQRFVSVMLKEKPRLCVTMQLGHKAAKKRQHLCCASVSDGYHECPHQPH